MHIILCAFTFILIIKSIKQVIPKFNDYMFYILAISPILIFNFGPYFADKFLHLLTWIIIYLLSQRKRLMTVVPFVLLGFLVKITFLWNIVFVLSLLYSEKAPSLQSVREYIRNIKGRRYITALLFISLLIPIFLWEQFSFEIIREHNFIKGVNFYIRFLTSLMSQAISPALYLQYFTMTKSSTVLALLEVLNLIIIVGSIIYCFLKKVSLKEIRNIVISIILYSTVLLLAIYEGSNFSDFTSDLYPFLLFATLFIIQKCSTKILKVYLVSLCLISVLWHIEYLQYGPADEISYRFQEAIHKNLKAQNIDGIIVESKYDLGMIDFVSNGKIKSSFFELNPLRARNYKGTCLLRHNYQNWGKEYPLSRSKITEQMISNKLFPDSIIGKYNSPKARLICVK